MAAVGELTLATANLTIIPSGLHIVKQGVTDDGLEYAVWLSRGIDDTAYHITCLGVTPEGRIKEKDLDYSDVRQSAQAELL